MKLYGSMAMSFIVGWGMHMMYSSGFAFPEAPASQVLDPVKVAKWNAMVARHKQSADACIANGGTPLYQFFDSIQMEKCQYPVQVVQTPCVEVGK